MFIIAALLFFPWTSYADDSDSVKTDQEHVPAYVVDEKGTRKAGEIQAGTPYSVDIEAMKKAGKDSEWIPIQVGNAADSQRVWVEKKALDPTGLSAMINRVLTGERTSCGIPNFDSFIQSIPYKAWSYYQPDGNPKAHCATYNQNICEVYKKLTKSDIPNLDTFYFFKAIIEHESGFDPNAYRIENNKLRTASWFVKPWKQYRKDFPSEEEMSAAKKYEASYGLMQVLYPLAAGDYGFKGKPEELADVDTNLYFGIKHLVSKLKAADKSLKEGGPAKRFNRYQLAAAAFNYGSVKFDEGELQFHDDYVSSMSSHMKTFKATCGFASVKEACSP